MATVGEILKQKRQEQNLTLHDVSEVTKISTNFLDAIENNAFKKLPRGVFPKMFIRAYARHLGLDDDRLIQLYFEQAAEIESEETPAPEGPRMAPIRRRRGHWTRILVAAVVMGALLGTSYLVYRASESSPPLSEATPPEPPPPLADPHRHRDLRRPTARRPQSRISPLRMVHSCPQHPPPRRPPANRPDRPPPLDPIRSRWLSPCEPAPSAGCAS